MTLDTRIYRGPEIESNHYLLVCSISMELRWYERNKKNNIYTSFKVNLFTDFSKTWLYKRRLRILVQETPTGDNVEEE
jgi:hypothetical protein